MRKRSYFGNNTKGKSKISIIDKSESYLLKKVNKSKVTFGEYIKAKRIDKNIKFNDLKDYIGCTTATLSKYMADEMFPSPQRMSLLCSVLEINSVFLYALTNKIHPDLQWKLVTLIREDSEKVVEMINKAFGTRSSIGKEDDTGVPKT